MECLYSSIRKIREIKKAKKWVKFLEGLQARKFGVNDRLAYTSFTKIIIGVNDKSFASYNNLFSFTIIPNNFQQAAIIHM